MYLYYVFFRNWLIIMLQEGRKEGLRKYETLRWGIMKERLGYTDLSNVYYVNVFSTKKSK